ncbi:MAG TPA: formate dehydrogenase subunit alpha [Verrucomicrobiales bacterium]|nr:formate dehydrogenase subunit alpha [Verrucomicrobiales bacterium]
MRKTQRFPAMVQDISTLTAFIDGEPHRFETGDTLLNFIDRHRGRGFVPTLCDAPQLEPYGACRVCSVEVALQADGPRRVVASCHTPISAGMHIFTESQKVRRLRKNIVELVLTDHPLDCLTCEVSGNCELQTVAAKVGIRGVRYPAGANHLDRAKDRSHPYMTSELSKCINCSRCVRACDEVQGQHVLSMHGRGFNARIIKGLDQSFMDSTCVTCGACSQACPTSAISDVFFSKSIEATKKTRTVCTYCGVGCNLNVATKGDEVLSIQAPTDSEVNHSHTCLKGRYAFKFVKHPERLRKPLIRYNGHFTEATWDEAYDYIAKNLKRIKEEHGGNAVGGISSARCTNEENYLMQKFIRVGFGTNNIDACARVCHSPTAWGMQKAFGTGAATNSIEDLEYTNCILITGANPTEGHPVTGSKIKQRVMKGVPLIVIDPRQIELVPYATHHLQLRPGTNVALLDMFAYYILEAGLIDQDFIKKRCENWDEFEKGLRALDLDELERINGVPREKVRAAAIEYASAENAMAFHGLGVTEHSHGSKTVMTIADIAMMTGNIGRPGVGVCPLRGQNNVQGSCDMGSFPHELPGYRHVSDAATRALFDAAWGVEIDPEPGLRIPNMLEAALDGSFKGLYCQGEDIVQSDPNTQHVEAALREMECVVVQDIFLNETAKFAHVLLPGSSFLEKDGTFTNAERRISRVRKVMPPLAGKADWEVTVALANALGYPMHYSHPSEIMDEIARLTPSFTGVSYEKIRRMGSVQWPCNEEHPEGTPVMHVDEFVRGKGRFVMTEYIPTDEKIGPRYPLLLTTGRILSQYNVGAQTRRTANSIWHPEDVIEIHPHDAEERGIKDGDWVSIKSRAGETALHAQITDRVAPGVVYTTFHHPLCQANVITTDFSDWATNCPEYKVTAVQIARSNVPTTYQQEYEEFSDLTRRIVPAEAAE